MTMSRSVRLVILAATAFAAAACSDSAPPVATSITLSTPQVAFDAVGASTTVNATVSDQHGKQMQNVPVTWTSSSANATVAPITAQTALPSATVTAALSGTATITATAGGAHASL